MLNKKGQTGFIVFLLILLISIILIILIWNLINILVESKGSKIRPELLSVRLDVKEAVVFITGSSKITVQRMSGGEMDGLKFAFYDGGGDVEIVKVNGILNELETKVYNFGPVGVGRIERVSVFPVKEENIGREFESEIDDVFKVPSGMVSWWRFDDLSDFVGENHGSLTGSSTMENSILNLDGNGYFKVLENESLDMGDELSISAWVNGKGNVIEKGGNYKLAVGGDEIIFNFSDGGVDESKGFGNFEGWTHIAISLDWDGLLNFYINGARVGGKDLGILGKSPDLNDFELKIGDGFVGKIDEVMVFDKALSLKQIEGLYNFGRK